MKNQDFIIKAIGNLGIAIDCMAKAIEAEEYSGKIELLDVAVKLMKNAEYWIDETNILPF